MRKILCAAALVWALCVPALAGDIQSPPLVSEPPHTNVEPVQDGGGIILGGYIDSDTQIALELFAVMQSLF